MRGQSNVKFYHWIFCFNVEKYFLEIHWWKVINYEVIN